MPKKDNDRIGLAKSNYIILIIAAIILILGYFVMALNEISISPLLLMLAYVILIPFALLKRGKKD